MLYKFYFEKLVETEELLNRHTVVDTLPNIKKYSSFHLLRIIYTLLGEVWVVNTLDFFFKKISLGSLMKLDYLQVECIRKTFS